MFFMFKFGLPDYYKGDLCGAARKICAVRSKANTLCSRVNAISRWSGLYLKNAAI
jgi:hypothetical protein